MTGGRQGLGTSWARAEEMDQSTDESRRASRSPDPFRVPGSGPRLKSGRNDGRSYGLSLHLGRVCIRL